VETLNADAELGSATHCVRRGAVGTSVGGHEFANGGASDMQQNRLTATLLVVITMVSTGCATIVNDPMIPLSVTFSDGSAGECSFKNKRGAWAADIPTTSVMIRRSDDALVYDCRTEDGRTAQGSIRSEVEGEKMAASVIFWDLGITDAITDKHRTYQGNVVIPIVPRSPG